jgi:hypothetical protein
VAFIHECPLGESGAGTRRAMAVMSVMFANVLILLSFIDTAVSP